MFICDSSQKLCINKSSPSDGDNGGKSVINNKHPTKSEKPTVDASEIPFPTTVWMYKTL